MAERKGFANRVENQEISLIRRMSMLADEVPGTISLGQGIPPFELPVKEELAKAIMEVENINDYSLEPGMTELREEIARKLRRSRGIDVDPKTEVYVSAGAAGALNAAIMAMVDRGQEAIMLSPTYSPFILNVKFAEGIPRFAPLIEEEEWKPDISGLEKAVNDNTKVIILANPGNPTGTVYDEEVLREIGDIALRNGLFLIMDETYDFLTYDGKKHFSLASVPEFKNNLVTVLSSSKENAMTGLRIGYVYAQEDIINKMLIVHDLTVIAAPTPSQYGALFAMREPQKHVEEYVREYTRRREQICERLDGLGHIFEYQKPRGSYYVFARIKPETRSLLPYDDSFDFSKRLLYEAKVVTIPGLEFGPEEKGNEHIRFSFAHKEKAINDAFDRLEGYFNSLKIQS